MELMRSLSQEERIVTRTDDENINGGLDRTGPKSLEEQCMMCDSDILLT